MSDQLEESAEGSSFATQDRIDPVIESGSRGDPVESPPIAFGPVPSRRLGRSLGINNIPPKICTYSCLYCQVGPTMDRAVEPRALYPPEQIVAEVIARIEHVRERGESIDYLAFVPDGEPTLDARLGESIGMLRTTGIDIAVITNGSLLWRSDVREALGAADWVSVKVDAAIESVRRRLDRPHPGIDFTQMQEGIGRFAREFQGDLVSETMLIDGVNDSAESVSGVGRFLSDAGIGVAYLSIPTRPTPYPSITSPDEETVNRAYQVLEGYVPRVEYLIGYEGDEFGAGGDPGTDLLSITAVHPMRASAVRAVLARDGATWDVVEDLVAEGETTEVTYRNEQFYVRRFRA